MQLIFLWKSNKILERLFAVLFKEIRNQFYSIVDNGVLVL